MPKKNPPKKTVIIKKSRWSRYGTSKGCRHTEKLKANFKQSLLCKDGKKCCLGFICIQALDKTTDEIRGYGVSPRDTYQGIPEWYTSRICRAASINDDTETSDACKIRLLKKLFEKSTIRLKFIP